jgi:uncharacterized protein (UPF0210 family)
MAKSVFENAGYEVQTIRLTTQPWDRYLGHLSKKRLLDTVVTIEQVARENGIDFINLGTVSAPEAIYCIPLFIKATSGVSLSASITSKKKNLLVASISAAAQAIKDIARTTEGGYGNFRFAAIANCPPHIPFYPASYHAGNPCFSIALECSDLVVRSCRNGGDLARAAERLFHVMTCNLQKLERLARLIERDHRIRYCGIDTSPAPSLKKNESLVIAFEHVLHDRFGAPGTLSVARMMTGVLKSIPVQRCGYCGLMLPILEDRGLARVFGEGTITLTHLLSISSVCGTGLDCVPLPGSISIEKLQAILRDVAVLACSLNKPLSARLFPLPGKKAGELTDFKSPYLMNCRLPRLF